MQTDASGGPKGVSRRLLNGKKGRNVVGREVVQRLEGVDKSAELDTLFNREPVELLQKRGGMGAFWFLEDEAGTPILNSLKTSNVLLGDAIEESTTIIQLRENKSTDRTMGGVEIKEPTDSVQVPNLEVQRTRQLSHMIAHLHLTI